MKKITLILALICSMSLWAESQHGTVFVKPGGTGDGSSWENALGDIQTAIGKARENSDARKDVWVAGGTFVLTESISMQDSINVYGSFAGTETAVEQRSKIENGKAWEFVTPTTLEADGCRLVQMASNFDIPTVVDGFIMTGGNGVGTATNNNGGGAIIRQNGILQNCIIKNCETIGGGGGVMINGGGVVRFCLIKDNKQSTNGNGGGGIFCNTSSLGFEAFIENCEITGNTSTIRGAGLGIQGESNVYVSNCKIYNNIAINGTTLVQGAGIFANSANNEIVNCAIYNNTGTNTVRLITKKFVNNTVVKNVGGIYLAAGSLTAQIKNNIVWSCWADLAGETATSLTGVAFSGMPVQNNATYNPIPAGNWLTTVGEDEDAVETNIVFASNGSNGDIKNPENEDEIIGSGPHFVKVTSFSGAVDLNNPELTAEDIEMLLAEFDAADWSLNRQSPCVNAGQNLEYLVSDIVGENRPQGFPFETAKTDIGAYELPYYAVAFAAYDTAKGLIFDRDGNDLYSDNVLGFGKGEEALLYFYSETGALPYNVSITRSNNGGLTFDGETTDITDQLNDEGIWAYKVFFPFRINVAWDDTSGLANIDNSKIRCFALNNSIQINGLSTGENVSVYHINGALVSRVKANESTLNIPVQAGIYVVRIDDAARKVVVK